MRYYEAIKAALAPLGIPFFHNTAHKQATRYIVWNEVKRLSGSADNRSVNAMWRIAVDYFTVDEYDDNPERIIAALEAADIKVTDCVSDYEEKTKRTHYAMTAEVFENGH